MSRCSALLLAWLVSTGALAQTNSAETNRPQTEPVGNYVVVDQTVPQALTAQAGDSERGLAVVLDRSRGHCLLCHSVAAIDEPSQGNIGPALDTVGKRLSAAALRLRLIDGTKINPATAMPAYYRTADLQQVGRAYLNQPVLTAQEIEDVVAWLQTLGGADDN